VPARIRRSAFTSRPVSTGEADRATAAIRRHRTAHTATTASTPANQITPAATSGATLSNRRREARRELREKRHRILARLGHEHKFDGLGGVGAVAARPARRAPRIAANGTRKLERRDQPQRVPDRRRGCA
jgi:hypothetical protein